MRSESYDKIIIGGGLYGLYSAVYCAERGEKVIVLERDNGFFMRATYINQARVHKGYHYPRSFSTAIKSAGYFKRFIEDYGFCINKKFKKIYATSQYFSYTNKAEFIKFCQNAGIPCKEIPPDQIFKKNCVDGAFLCEEYTYDAHVLLKYFLERIHDLKVKTMTGVRIKKVEKQSESWDIYLQNGERLSAPFVLNATYASVNQILKMFHLEETPFPIKYELCEIILCNAHGSLCDKGITVMDGPFFSIMPFGLTGYHSLTAVSSTPHYTSYDLYPQFSCQQKSGGYCSPQQLGNCNECPAKPESAWPYMSALAHKYLKDEYGFDYVKSLFSMKPILTAAEVDDSRPTVIKEFCQKPTLVSVLSGKINTVYDLDEYLKKN